MDICENGNPDVVADMRCMGDIGQFDALYCCHALEHVYPHEVETAVSEFRRVLKDGGHAIVFVPDLEDVRPTDEALFVSDAGPIAGLDLIYGFRQALRDSPQMAHHTGFTADSLYRAFVGGGFSKVEIKRLAPYNLMAVAIR